MSLYCSKLKVLHIPYKVKGTLYETKPQYLTTWE